MRVITWITGVETIKRQIRAAYGCSVEGQSPWARAKTMAYGLYACSASHTHETLQLSYVACGVIYVLLMPRMVTMSKSGLNFLLY